MDTSQQVDGGEPRTLTCLVDLPVMLEEIVRDALTGALVEIVPDPASLARICDEGRTAVIITSEADDVALERFRSPLLAAPAIAVLAIAESGRGATLSQLWPVERALGELSEPLLVETVRSVMPWNERLSASGRQHAGPRPCT